MKSNNSRSVGPPGKLYEADKPPQKKFIPWPNPPVEIENEDWERESQLKASWSHVFLDSIPGYGIHTQ